jgi:HEAT repeat protein
MQNASPLGWLCQRLRDEPDEEIRRAAAEALEALGEAAATHPAVLPALVAALGDRNGEVRIAAAGALRAMGYPDAEVEVDQ